MESKITQHNKESQKPEEIASISADCAYGSKTAIKLYTRQKQRQRYHHEKG